MNDKVHITQPCANSGRSGLIRTDDGRVYRAACSMKVETLLPVGATIPEPRLCVFCKSGVDSAAA